MTGARAGLDVAVHRAEVVGSLLRPAELVRARAQMRAGQRSAEDLQAIEDAAVDDALRLQEEVEVDVVTDGEMRRDIFFDFLVKGFGFSAFTPGSPYTVHFHGHGDTAMEVEVPFTVTDRLVAGPCPGLDEYVRSEPHPPAGQDHAAGPGDDPRLLGRCLPGGLSRLA